MASGSVEIRTVKVSDKGQVSIPKDIRKNMKIMKGDNLVMLANDNQIILKKSESIALLLDGEFKDIEAFTEHTLKSVWDNQYDEVWNKDATTAKLKKIKINNV
jgi:AbrB family looped-hinge helix DNA binding protein